MKNAVSLTVTLGDHFFGRSFNMVEPLCRHDVVRTGEARAGALVAVIARRDGVNVSQCWAITAEFLTGHYPPLRRKTSWCWWKPREPGSASEGRARSAGELQNIGGIVEFGSGQSVSVLGRVDLDTLCAQGGDGYHKSARTNRTLGQPLR